MPKKRGTKKGPTRPSMTARIKQLEVIVGDLRALLIDQHRVDVDVETDDRTRASRKATLDKFRKEPAAWTRASASGAVAFPAPVHETLETVSSSGEDEEVKTQSNAEAEAREVAQAIQDMGDHAFEAQREREHDARGAEEYSIYLEAAWAWRRMHPKTMACMLAPQIKVSDKGLSYRCECCEKSAFFSFAGLRDTMDSRRNQATPAEQMVKNLEFSMDAQPLEPQDAAESFAVGPADRRRSILRKLRKPTRLDEATVFDRHSQPTRAPVRSGYGDLARILDEALEQAQRGKGVERHSRPGEAFADQQIVQLCEWLGSIDGDVFQACKKALEAKRLPYDAARRELLGAINCLAAAVLVLDRIGTPEPGEPPFR